jgi:hypothetical protein
MGTVAQAVEAFRIYANEPAPRSRQIARHLIDDRLLPKSAGKRIEHLSAYEVALYLLALSTAKKAADAAWCASTWGMMTLDGVQLRPPAAGEPPQGRLLNMIAGMFAYVWSENGNGPMTDIVLRSTLEITTTSPHAIIDFNGKRENYLPPGGDPLSGRQRVDRIPGATLRQIAMALSEGRPRNANQARQPDISRDPSNFLSAPLAR